MESKRAPASRTTKTEPTLKQEAENPATTATIKNDAIIGGLALQRLCDEKPDIDNLTNSLMQLYYNIQFKGGEGDGHKDILDRIVLSALRVKSKMELYINRVSWRVKAMLRQARRVVLKRRCIMKNVSLY